MPRWPRFEQDEIDAAVRVLESGAVNYWTGGEGRAFETEFSTYLEMPYAIALANGTVALELALWALGIDSGEVVVPARTFVATANAVRMRGLTPVFADVDRASGCITRQSVESCISGHTRAVIAVHLGGWPCEMGELQALCEEHDLFLIEDCAQAHGATHRGRKVGSFGHASAFSFCQDKIMTTAGEGGMLILRDEETWKRAWSYKDHGKDWDRVHNEGHPPGFRWLHAQLGTNWRLSEVQSAVGRVQLRKLDSWLTHRRSLAARYNERLSGTPGLRLTSPPPYQQHACYKHYVYVVARRLHQDWSRDRILRTLLAKGISCGSGSCSEVYLEDSFPTSMRPGDRLPVARELGETSLMFMVDPTRTIADVHEVCAALIDIMREATK